MTSQDKISGWTIAAMLFMWALIIIGFAVGQYGDYDETRRAEQERRFCEHHYKQYTSWARDHGITVCDGELR